ncbi:uncharacterized protein LOC135502071 [Lineus longissimus]|uniref:uncharacterized protein LOC135502071 n=1 Tax=Lineus longissimus TaxID=88925 RepID=UPI00315D9120
MESPKLNQPEEDVSAKPGHSSDEEDEMVICSSRDLQRQQSVISEEMKSNVGSDVDGAPSVVARDENSFNGEVDGCSSSNDKDTDTDKLDLDNSLSESKIFPILGTETENEIETKKTDPNSAKRKLRSDDTEKSSDSNDNSAACSFDSELKDENSNTQFCSDKSALESTQKTDCAEGVSLPETIAQVTSDAEEASSAETNHGIESTCSKMDELPSVEVDRCSSPEVDVSPSSTDLNISLSAEKNKCSVSMNSPTCLKEEDSISAESHKLPSVEINKSVDFGKRVGQDIDDAVVIAASWIPDFEDDILNIDLKDKDAAIIKLKSQVTKLTSVVRVKDETLKFIEEQTKAEVDKMSAEITLLRATLVDEQKKVTRLEEDVKKRDDVIEKFKSSFERIGKAIAVPSSEADSKSDEEMLKTLSMVKDSLPTSTISSKTSPPKELEPQVPQHAPSPVVPPAAHGKSPSIPPYASRAPVSPSQGSLAPIHSPMVRPNPHLKSPRVGALGSARLHMSGGMMLQQSHQASFMGRGMPLNSYRPIAPLRTPRPAHQKEKSNLPGQVTSFGEAMSFCVQKHMSGQQGMYPHPNLGPRLTQGVPLPPTAQIPLTGLPHGNQPSLPLQASSPTPTQSPPTDQTPIPNPAHSPTPPAPAPATPPNPGKKRSRRKNPNPLSIKRAKVECYERFEVPSTPPPEVTEPSVMIERSLLDEEDDAPYEIPEELRSLTPIHIKQEILDEISSPLPSMPTPSVFPGLLVKDEPGASLGEPVTTQGGAPSFKNENSNDSSPMIVNVQSLATKAKEFKLRRESFESGSDVNSPIGGTSMHSEDSEYETYANKPRHKCTFCQPSTSFSYCNDLLMHLYNQHKHVTCDEIQSYLLSTVDVLTEQVLTNNDDFYKIAGENDANSSKKGNMCRICLRMLPSRYMFILHMSSHTGEKPYKCEFCSKRFVDGVSLWKHKKLHAEEHPEVLSPRVKTEPNASGKPYHCDECGKGFLHQGSLSNHRKLHIGWKPYRCEGCGKEFTRNASLMIHMRSHTKETPFKCQLCGKGFTQSCNLNTHLRIHRGEKPFHCPICNKNFSRKFVLQKHRCLDGVRDVKRAVSSDRSEAVPVSMVSA